MNHKNAQTIYDTNTKSSLDRSHLLQVTENQGQGQTFLRPKLRFFCSRAVLKVEASRRGPYPC